MSAATESPIPTPDEKVKGQILTNKQYDTITQLVQKGLPAVGALYAGLAVLWGFPHGQEVVGSLALLATFGGVLLGISNRRYESTGAKYDGEVQISSNPDEPHTLIFNPPLSELEGNKQITLKVSGP